MWIEGFATGAMCVSLALAFYNSRTAPAVPSPRREPTGEPPPLDVPQRSIDDGAGEPVFHHHDFRGRFERDELILLFLRFRPQRDCYE